ncbi:hypothetical protein LZ30DRAFT_739409, partial [Colletotrichum cereale]
MIPPGLLHPTPDLAVVGYRCPSTGGCFLDSSDLETHIRLPFVEMGGYLPCPPVLPYDSRYFPSFCPSPRTTSLQRRWAVLMHDRKSKFHQVKCGCHIQPPSSGLMYQPIRALTAIDCFLIRGFSCIERGGGALMEEVLSRRESGHQANCVANSSFSRFGTPLARRQRSQRHDS